MVGLAAALATTLVRYGANGMTIINSATCSMAQFPARTGERGGDLSLMLVHRDDPFVDQLLPGESRRVEPPVSRVYFAAVTIRDQSVICTRAMRV